MSGSSERRTVLVVEDDQWIRYLVADALRDRGFVVLEASNGHTGLLLAERSDPDVVLLDLTLPETSGVEVLRELKRHRPIRDPRVIVVSAHADLLSPRQALDVDALFTKPFDLNLLVEEIVSGSGRGAIGYHRSVGVDVGAGAS